MANRDDNNPPHMRLVRLADRQSVHIQDDQWPSVADAQWSVTGETTKGWLRVRRQEDSGRALIYGQLDAANFAESLCSGELVDAAQDLEAAIARVGQRLSAPHRAIVQCIASLHHDLGDGAAPDHG